MAAWPMTPSALAGLIGLVERGAISGPIAKSVFEKMLASGAEAAAIVAAEGLGRIDDESRLRSIVRDVLAAHPAALEQLRAGKQATFGFLVGQVMKATGGKANPSIVNDLLRAETGDGPRP
jgi:aspartyl-tRNA(Asn)/glutamyl-tRNA(Gln) amidotransferase subunit B